MTPKEERPRGLGRGLSAAGAAGLAGAVVAVVAFVADVAGAAGAAKAGSVAAVGTGTSDIGVTAAGALVRATALALRPLRAPSGSAPTKARRLACTPRLPTSSLTRCSRASGANRPGLTSCQMKTRRPAGASKSS